MRTILRIVFLCLCTCVVSAIELNAAETLIIPNGGQPGIYGTISLPDNMDECKGMVIVSHGFNGTHDFARCYFSPLNDMGYAVYAFDYPDGSVKSRSGNNTMNMSIVDSKKTLINVVNYFKDSGIYKNIVLVGESQGGLISTLAALDITEDITGLVLIYPALGIPDEWNSRYGDIKEIPDTTRIWNVPLGKRFFSEMTGMKVYERLGNFNKPVLIVHGTVDAIIPLESSERATTLFPQSVLRIIEGAGHGFNEQERQVSNSYVVEFLSTL